MISSYTGAALGVRVEDAPELDDRVLAVGRCEPDADVVVPDELPAVWLLALLLPLGVADEAVEFGIEIGGPPEVLIAMEIDSAWACGTI